MSETEHLRWLCAALAGELARSWCAGSKSCRDRWDRQRRPVPGDLVVEESTHFHGDTSRVWGPDHGYGDRLGRLLAVRHEPIDADPEDWAPEPLPTERVWYIALPDGRVHRWVNASFAAVPDIPVALPPA